MNLLWRCQAPINTLCPLLIIPLVEPVPGEVVVADVFVVVVVDAVVVVVVDVVVVVVAVGVVIVLVVVSKVTLKID